MFGYEKAAVGSMPARTFQASETAEFTRCAICLPVSGVLADYEIFRISSDI